MVLKRLSEIEMSDEGEFRKVRRDRIFEKDYFDKKYGALPEVSDGFDLIEAMKGGGRSLLRRGGLSRHEKAALHLAPSGLRRRPRNTSLGNKISRKFTSNIPSRNGFCGVQNIRRDIGNTKMFEC